MPSKIKSRKGKTAIKSRRRRTIGKRGVDGGVSRRHDMVAAAGRPGRATGSDTRPARGEERRPKPTPRGGLAASRLPSFGNVTVTSWR